MRLRAAGGGRLRSRISRRTLSGSPAPRPHQPKGSNHHRTTTSLKWWSRDIRECCAATFDECPSHLASGKLQITQASHVAPDRDGFWWADMGQVEGPVLGPFSRRTEALQAERGWLLEVHPGH